LYLNGELIVREGGLKRGPYPDYYYVDTLRLAPHLRIGENTLGLLLWYFGKDGFSHQSGHLPGIWLDGPAAIRSDERWRAIVHPAFGHTGPPHPNYRLPESNVHFNAAQYDDDWKRASYSVASWPGVKTYPAGRPSTTMHLRPRHIDLDGRNGQPRPVPQWTDSGLLPYPDPWPRDPKDTLKLRLPYNAQVTPYFRINAPRARLKIEILTDNYRGGGPPNVRTVYYTKAGVQSFETPGWLNGHEVWYVFPAGTEVLDLRYRESGFATAFTGSFVTDDPALNTLWTEAQRTLYLTMRDTYMDCPDRERAQWWGDVVNELGETFYALDRRSDLLTAKAIRELMAWQRPDSTIFSPVPAGNWNQELPMQMLASVGKYGIWHYYFNSGDGELLGEVYPAIKRYVHVWETQANGLVVPRKGGWTWGDWGQNKDLPILYNCWYYLALEGLQNMALLLEDEAEVAFATARMKALQAAFHNHFWTGTAYRSPQYRGATDERGHALAVVSGLAPKSAYPAIFQVFREQEHASPYMEKYVLEALALMGRTDYAITRMKKRFGKMIADDLTTLYEGWGIGKEGYGGGTYNHAWSGGALTVMSQFLGGAEPTSPGWATYRIQPGGWESLREATTAFDTPRGRLEISWQYNGKTGLMLEHTADFHPPYVDVALPAGMVPRGTTPEMEFTRVSTQQGQTIWRTAANRFRLVAIPEK
ncbi:MAG: alpha-L-rhamnosidase C-terminal domain-containing protein, partial [Bacteroidota bacterium]